MYINLDTSAGLKRKAALVQPLGKVGLVNLGNSCFMNSALRALFCSGDFLEAVLNDISKYVRLCERKLTRNTC